jgi:DNA-directed RNA polymerase specialized sigma24 family protein
MSVVRQLLRGRVAVNNTGSRPRRQAAVSQRHPPGAGPHVPGQGGVGRPHGRGRRASAGGRPRPADPMSAAVAALPPPQRVAVVLHHFEGLPDQEIARITGSTGPAIRGQLLQGRRALARAPQDRN